jgi:hypothetical protein
LLRRNLAVDPEDFFEWETRLLGKKSSAPSAESRLSRGCSIGLFPAGANQIDETGPINDAPAPAK